MDPKFRSRLLTLSLTACAATSLSSLPAIAKQPFGGFVQIANQGHAISLALGAMMAQAAVDRATWSKTHPQSGSSAVGLRMIAGTVITQVVQVGNALSYPAVEFQYATGGSSLSGALFVFKSPSGTQQSLLSYSLANGKSAGTLSFTGNTSLGLFSEPGVWTLQLADLFDRSGAQTQYDAAQLATIFVQPSFTVVNNGIVDATAPVVKSGSLVTPIVKLSSANPTFEASVQASDNFSGLSELLVYFTPPGFPFSVASIYPLPYPILKGELTNYFPLANAPIGTYPITGYEVCDFAQNCLIDNNIADVQALFGATSFRVTK